MELVITDPYLIAVRLIAVENTVKTLEARINALARLVEPPVVVPELETDGA